jgi:rhodanese-related sulfurtransferase
MAKQKINDDTLLQLIRDGNSSAEAALFLSAASYGNVRQEKKKLDINLNLLAN